MIFDLFGYILLKIETFKNKYRFTYDMKDNIYKLDKTDVKIICELQRDADRTVYQLAKYLGLKRSTVYNRVAKLKKAKVIKGMQAILDYKRTGTPLCAFILVRTKKAVKIDELCAEISKLNAVEEIHPITGSFDVLLKARFQNINDLGVFTLRKLSTPYLANKILRTETIISLGTYKEYFRST